MITIFFSPKPFNDSEINIAQRNAIASWKALGDGVDIILFGDEDGCVGVSEEFSLKHVPNVPCNSEGLPIVKEMFSIAESMSSNDLLMYINSDIILLRGFNNAVRSIDQEMSGKPYLVVGQRHDFDLYESIDFSDKYWEKKLTERVLVEGKLRGDGAIDYFLFRKNMWPETMPPFVIGRVQFDNWLIYCARFMRIHVVDATQTICAVHQNHEQKEGYYFKRRQSPEALEQIKLTSAMKQNFLISDASLIHTAEGLRKPRFSVPRIKRFILTGSSLYPGMSYVFVFLHQFLSFVLRFQKA